MSDTPWWIIADMPPPLEVNHVTVPVVPTEEMMRAMTDGFIAVNGDNRKAFEQGYRAMIDAAIAQQKGQP